MLSRFPFPSSRAASRKVSAPRRNSLKRPGQPVASEPTELLFYASLPEWFRAWRQVVRNWWARLKYLHTQVPLWERGHPSEVLQADVRAARRLLKHNDLKGAIAALPAYRAYSSSGVSDMSTAPTTCRTKSSGTLE